MVVISPKHKGFSPNGQIGLGWFVPGEKPCASRQFEVWLWASDSALKPKIGVRAVFYFLLFLTY